MATAVQQTGGLLSPFSKSTNRQLNEDCLIPSCSSSSFACIGSSEISSSENSSCDRMSDHDFDTGGETRSLNGLKLNEHINTVSIQGTQPFSLDSPTGMLPNKQSNKTVQLSTQSDTRSNHTSESPSTHSSRDIKTLEDMVQSNKTVQPSAQNDNRSNRTSESLSTHSSRDIKTYEDEIYSLKNQCRHFELCLKEERLKSESTEAILNTYTAEIKTLMSERDQLLNAVQQMQERPTTSSEDGDRYSYGVDADSHQRALEELVALEKEVTQARQQHQQAQEQIRQMALRMSTCQKSQTQEINDLQRRLRESNVAYEELLHQYKLLKQSHSTLELQLEEAYRLKRDAEAQNIYATTPADFRATGSFIRSGSEITQTLRSHPPAFAEYSKSMHRIRVPNLENWGDGFHKLPTNGPRNAYFFPVNIQESRLALQLRLNGPVWLRIDPDCIALLEQETWNDLIECPLGCIRKYGKDEGVLSFEFGRSSPTGQGVLFLATVHMEDIFDVLNRFTGS